MFHTALQRNWNISGKQCVGSSPENASNLTIKFKFLDAIQYGINKIKLIKFRKSKSRVHTFRCLRIFIRNLIPLCGTVFSQQCTITDTYTYYFITCGYIKTNIFENPNLRCTHSGVLLSLYATRQLYMVPFSHISAHSQTA